MTQTINASNFGAWVLKCDPKVWGLVEYLEDGNDEVDNWSVQDNYRSRMMAPGDPVVLWVSGSASSKTQAGIWGLGHVTGPVEMLVELQEDSEGIEGADGDYWLDPRRRASAQFFAIIDVRLHTSPLVLREQLRSDPALAQIEPMRAPQMSNPSWLNADEWSAIQQLLDGPSLEEFRQRQNTGARLADDGIEADPDTREIVEACAIEAVFSELETDSWDVEDVQAADIGWDLTARRGGERRCVEVKGRGTSSTVVQISANELRAAREEKDWELALVTSAVTNPVVSWHTATAVLATAEPITYRATLSR